MRDATDVDFYCIVHSGVSIERLLEISEEQLDNKFFYTCEDRSVLRVNVRAFRRYLKRAQEPEPGNGKGGSCPKRARMHEPQFHQSVDKDDQDALWDESMDDVLSGGEPGPACWSLSAHDPDSSHP